jgi:amino acid permease
MLVTTLAQRCREVNINTVCALGEGGVSTQSMVTRTLGRVGAAVSAVAFIFLHYGLLVAAISKGSELTASYAGMPSAAAGPAFPSVSGAFCIFAKPKLLDLVNTGVSLRSSMSAHACHGVLLGATQGRV